MANNTEQDCLVWDFKTHAKNKSMWKGASKKVQSTEWIYNLSTEKFEKADLNYSPALFKSIDEILVNACDHWAKHRTSNNPVTHIDVTLDSAQGKISVTNDGPGIPVFIHPKSGVYWVETIVTHEFSGTNLKNDPNRVVGGTNGLGIKLVAISSSEFSIETVDSNRNKYYQQSFRNELDIIDKPTIIDLKSTEAKRLKAVQKKSHTTISFIPMFSRLGYKKYDPVQDGNVIEQLIVMRLYQIATFISSIGQKCKISYKSNGKTINFSLPHGLLSFAKLFPVEDVISLKMNKKSQYPWELCIGFLPGSGFEHLSIVNGIYAKSGGTHITHLQNKLLDHLSTKINKIFSNSTVKFQKNMVLNNIFIFMAGQVTNPQWVGQTKDSLRAGRNKFKDYDLTSTSIKKIWSVIRPILQNTFIQKEIASDQKKKQIGHVDKYDKAQKAGTKLSHKCCLLIPEGDSAANTVDTGIKNKETTLSTEYYGTFNIGGVPMNARKKVDIRKTSNGQIILRKKSLKDNERLSSLVSVLGLDYTKNYELNTQGNKEFKTLRYGCVIVVVDQDLDGMGNIFGLLLNFFALFWPNLIKRGFVKILSTPVVRAYPLGSLKRKETVKEFYSEKDFEIWWETINLDLQKSWKVLYYKGLASHDTKETVQMFKKFHNNLFTMTWDKLAAINMEIYYGKEANKRKTELSNPINYMFEPPHNMEMSCSRQLKVPTKEYQLGVIKRKMPHALDGFVPTQRKIFASARIVFKKNSSEKKVFAFGGDVTTLMHYHHGDMSLNGTIARMAQNFMGACNLPLLLPLGEFGKRTGGTGNFGSPRYTKTKLNKRLAKALFPPQDDWLLELMNEDGYLCEPRFYVPIIPLSILEHHTTTSVGWKIQIWARDFAYVLNNVRRLIRGAKPVSMMSNVWLIDKYDINGEKLPNHMTIKCMPSSAGIVECCMGSYYYDDKKNIVHINELPLRVWSKPYCEQLRKKEFVDKVIDNCDETISIDVHLSPNSINTICNEYGNAFMDPIEQYLNLRQPLEQQLNMIGIDGSVIEFSNYLEILKYWFPIRRDYYQQRIEREILILKLQIRYMNNLIKFIDLVNKDKISLYRKPRDKANTILATHKFVRFNKTTLFQPRYIPVNQLENAVLVKNASYDYIYHITQEMMLNKAVTKRQQKLKEMKDRLKELQETTYQKLWLNELDELEKIVKEGIRTRWLFEDSNFKWD